MMQLCTHGRSCKASLQLSQQGVSPVQEAGVLGHLGVVLGGLAQDVPDFPQLQLAVFAGVRPVKELLAVAQRLLLLQRHQIYIDVLRQG